MEHKAILICWIECFNTKNLEGLIALYHPEAEHFSPKLKIRKPETGGWVKGQDALRNWWNDAFINIPSLRYHLNYSISEGNRLFFEYVRYADGEPNMVIGECFTIENGKITSSKVFHS